MFVAATEERRVRIAHISDLHIGEDLVDGGDDNVYISGRAGHDVHALIALGRTLRTLEIDVLVVSGDVTRIGNNQSFLNFNTWLQDKIFKNGNLPGANIIDRSIPCIIVPGNHDRFGGTLSQSTGSRDRFSNHISEFQDGGVRTITIRGLPVHFHTFDSSTSDGGFGEGAIDPDVMFPKPEYCVDGALNIAVLHHDVFLPPFFKRTPGAALRNRDQALTFFLTAGFDAVMYGHTHKAYFDVLPAGSIVSMCNDPRRGRRFGQRAVNKMLKKLRSKHPTGDQYSAYDYRRIVKRPKTASGLYPSTASWIDFLHLQEIVGVKGLKGPREHGRPEDFYRYLDDVYRRIQEEPISSSDIVSRRRVAMCMAPSSALVSKDHPTGFGVLECIFQIDMISRKSKLVSIIPEYYKYVAPDKFERKQYHWTGLEVGWPSEVGPNVRAAVRALQAGAGVQKASTKPIRVRRQ